MIKTIILDLDGPILEGKLRHYQCYSNILLENGFVPMLLEEYWEMKRQRLDRHKQLAASGADGIYNSFLASWLQRIEEKSYLMLDYLQPQVIQKLEIWKSKGITLVLATLRNNRSNLFWQLEGLRLLPLFDHVVAVNNVESGSGKAEAVKKAIEPIDLEAVLWVGDTEIDIMAARQLGVKVCVVACGLRTADYLETFDPEYIVPDLQAIEFV